MIRAMGDAITYRELRVGEAPELAHIDRTEHIDGTYRLQRGALAFEATSVEVLAWESGELNAYVARLEKLQAAGGAVFGAWNEQRLVGLASLDRRPVGGNPEILKLDMLYVSASHRNRGVGTCLTGLVIDKGRSLGATALYISATPTRNTVDLYRRLGAQLLAVPNPALLAKEPNDVHLLLRISSG